MGTVHALACLDISVQIRYTGYASLFVLEVASTVNVLRRKPVPVILVTLRILLTGLAVSLPAHSLV
jgi:uncharacterized membrane protein (UPF0136 family)